MPLPVPPPTLTRAPARAGVGLRRAFERERAQRPPCDWPEDWWQRNYDTLWEECDPPPCPLTDRMMRVPNYPYPT